MAIETITSSTQIPNQDRLTESGSGTITNSWWRFFVAIKEALDPMGSERSFDLANGQTTAIDIRGLSFDKRVISHAIVEYLIQRVTSTTKISYARSFHAVYRPVDDAWEIQGFNVPLEGSFTNSGATCTKAAHGFVLGDSVQVKSSGTLPSGLSVSTNYYVIPLSFDTFMLATSFSGARGGVGIALASSGTGTHTIVPNPGVEISITASGQCQYKSTSISGTSSISRIVWRSRTLGAKHSSYSKVSGS